MVERVNQAYREYSIHEDLRDSVLGSVQRMLAQNKTCCSSPPGLRVESFLVLDELSNPNIIHCPEHSDVFFPHQLPRQILIDRLYFGYPCRYERVGLTQLLFLRIRTSSNDRKKVKEMILVRPLLATRGNKVDPCELRKDWCLPHPFLMHVCIPSPSSRPTLPFPDPHHWPELSKISKADYRDTSEGQINHIWISTSANCLQSQVHLRQHRGRHHRYLIHNNTWLSSSSPNLMNVPAKAVSLPRQRTDGWSSHSHSQQPHPKARAPLARTTQPLEVGSRAYARVWTFLFLLGPTQKLLTQVQRWNSFQKLPTICRNQSSLASAASLNERRCHPNPPSVSFDGAPHKNGLLRMPCISLEDYAHPDMYIEDQEPDHHMEVPVVALPLVQTPAGTSCRTLDRVIFKNLLIIIVSNRTDDSFSLRWQMCWEVANSMAFTRHVVASYIHHHLWQGNTIKCLCCWFKHCPWAYWLWEAKPAPDDTIASLPHAISFCMLMDLTGMDKAAKVFALWGRGTSDDNEILVLSRALLYQCLDASPCPKNCMYMWTSTLLILHNPSIGS
ncbi:hypothetical protein BCR41DRAFT_373304 [Lobosporangium transversale]|uniref:Uncharacterized protein n=1 Tax=Lobosporangium transversale TaxID=64571 RepID=A0A1Y2GE42_9FUNG|nr:hypothetical protein BCR41DRAFT_373304 [Lobosporangium transversale]ORZ08271.1 hypothetical protein BCR41DRAFT_373304 [Lobosporangium transversale]|eukprot:XP_021878354.1 hypothetical protein BCR41DRAFT_373304 [Lobosporangium transversale]